MVSQALRSAVDPRIVNFRYVDYPGSFGPATGVGDMSLERSVAVGKVEMTAAIQSTPRLVVTGGYSQGALVAIRHARDVLSHRRDLEVLAVATLGDPHQPLHGVWPLRKSGIAGPVDIRHRRFSLFVPGDPIADLLVSSPARSVADLGAWMSVRSLGDAREWVERTAVKAAQGRLQQWWNPGSWQSVSAGITSIGADLSGYLGTRHLAEYVSGGYVARLARLIEGVAA